MSIVRVDTLSNKAGTGPAILTGQAAARVWLEYDQTSNIVNASFGVSSVSDNSIGNVTVNYTNAFDGLAHGRSLMSNNQTVAGVLSRGASSTIFTSRSMGTTSLVDSVYYGSIHGNLA